MICIMTNLCTAPFAIVQQECSRLWMGRATTDHSGKPGTSLDKVEVSDPRSAQPLPGTWCVCITNRSEPPEVGWVFGVLAHYIFIIEHIYFGSSFNQNYWH